jgi:hypothetical protein
MNVFDYTAAWDTADKLFATFDTIATEDAFVDFVREHFYDEYRGIFADEADWLQKTGAARDNGYVYFVMQNEIPAMYGTNPLSGGVGNSSLTELKIIVFYNNLLMKKFPTPWDDEEVRDE